MWGQKISRAVDLEHVAEIIWNTFNTIKHRGPRNISTHTTLQARGSPAQLVRSHKTHVITHQARISQSHVIRHIRSLIRPGLTRDVDQDARRSCVCDVLIERETRRESGRSGRPMARSPRAAPAPGTPQRGACGMSGERGRAHTQRRNLPSDAPSCQSAVMLMLMAGVAC